MTATQYVLVNTTVGITKKKHSDKLDVQYNSVS